MSLISLGLQITQNRSYPCTLGLKVGIIYILGALGIVELGTKNHTVYVFSALIPYNKGPTSGPSEQKSCLPVLGGTVDSKKLESALARRPKVYPEAQGNFWWRLGNLPRGSNVVPSWVVY